jgi:Protein of unknown function (DUF3102).
MICAGKAVLAKSAEAIRKAEREARDGKVSVKLQIKPGSALDRKAKEIHRLYGEICAAARMSLSNATKIGGILTDVHESPAFKGKWLAFLAQSVPFSQKTAWRYMQYHRHREELVNLTNLSEADGLILALPQGESRKKKRSNKEVEDNQQVDNAPSGTPESPPEPIESQGRHKSQKQITKELQRIADCERDTEIKADEQLAVIIAKLNDKVRAQWLEFPDKLAGHARALVELSERLKLNTPRR